MRSEGLAGTPFTGEGEPASASDVNGEFLTQVPPEGSPPLALLRRSCLASGVPLRLEDQAAAARIADILRQT